MSNSTPSPDLAAFHQPILDVCAAYKHLAALKKDAGPRATWSAHRHTSVALAQHHIDTALDALTAQLRPYFPEHWDMDAYGFGAKDKHSTVYWGKGKGSGKTTTSFSPKPALFSYMVGLLVGLSWDSTQGRYGWPKRLLALGFTPDSLHPLTITTTVSLHKPLHHLPSKGIHDAMGRLYATVLERWPVPQDVCKHEPNATPMLLGYAIGNRLRRSKPTTATVVPILHQRLNTHPVVKKLGSSKPLMDHAYKTLTQDHLLRLEQWMHACLTVADSLTPARHTSPFLVVEGPHTSSSVSAWCPRSAWLARVLRDVQHLKTPNPNRWTFYATTPLPKDTSLPTF